MAISEKKTNLNCPAIFWTDSTAVFQIIQNSTKRFPVFVANRLAIINEHTQATAWRYVPSKLNSADFATRSISASHMGGAWERMIRSIRRILAALMTTQTLTDEALTTLMVEVEGIINSRPLVPVIMDPKDMEPPTPDYL